MKELIKHVYKVAWNDDKDDYQEMICETYERADNFRNFLLRSPRAKNVVLRKVMMLA